MNKVYFYLNHEQVYLGLLNDGTFQQLEFLGTHQDWTGLRKKEFWKPLVELYHVRCAKCIRISRSVNDNTTLKGVMYSQNANNTPAWSNLVNKLAHTVEPR